MECKKEKNLKDCSCTYPGCPRKGTCCDCLKHHLASNELPACCFSKEAEKTYDRSFEMFIKDQQGKL
ncbi:cytosolic protein [Patescibacteria group bacterium]|nr:cytosolic protein [Patescibacteria group bacterium]